MKLSHVIVGLVCFILAGSLVLNGCRRGDRFVYAGTPLPFTVPPGFPQPLYNFGSYPLTEESFLLGRKLFYEGRLSSDKVHPCSSCHQPVAAFTTLEHDRSHGVNGSHTLRNAPGLFNLAWHPAFMQDGRLANLEAVSLYHITAPDEMGETTPEVVSRLAGDTAYRRLFKAAYGSEEVTADRLLHALKQFVLGMVSADSRYDKVKRGAATFTTEESAGYVVFRSKCSTCHAEPLFTDFSYRNIGLPVNPNLNDYGRMRVTGSRADSLKFRVPSLRNVMFTSYYAHDGRFNFVQRIMDHYRSGVVQSPTLDPALAGGIAISATEETNLIAFLRTLSDSAFLNNTRYRE